jgi:hypothetical protein
MVVAEVAAAVVARPASGGYSMASRPEQMPYRRNSAPGMVVAGAVVVTQAARQAVAKQPWWPPVLPPRVGAAAH